MDALEHRNDNAGRQPGAVGNASSVHQSEFYYPSVESVRGRILGSLLRGEPLTQKDTLRRFSDFRLASQVEALRKSGWPIVTEIIDVDTRDAGRRSEVAQYRLCGEAIEAAGNIGRQYAAETLATEIRRRAE